jgi:hypothetical protein
MKKYHFKTIYRVAFCSLVIALLFSCRTDDIGEKESLQTGQSIVNRLNEKQLKSKAPAVFEKIKSLRREVINNPQLSRSVSLVGGFHIETDDVLEIIMGQVKTYTFAISKEDDESPLENLVIKVDGQGNLNGAIFEYYLTEEEKRNLESKIPINLKQKISWKPLENLEEAAELLLRSDIDCLKFVITGGSICPSGDHDLRQMLNDQCSIVNNGDFTPDPQTIVQIIVDPSCLNEGGPGNGGNTPEGGDGWYGPAWFPLQPGFPGSGDGVGPGDFPDNGDFHQGDYPYNQDEPSQDIWDNTFYTQPVLPQNDKKSPCNQLDKLKNSPNYSNTINHLKSKATGLKEYGWVSKYFDGTKNFAPPTVAGQDTQNPNSVNLAAYSGLEWIGAFHNHTTPTEGNVPMFSPTDLQWLFTKARLRRKFQVQSNLPVDVSDLFLGLVNENEVYCLKIKDVDKFLALTAPNYLKLEEDLVQKFTQSGSNSSPKTLQKDFLKVLKAFDLGIGLYEQDSNGSWSEVNLNPTNSNDNPVNTPCN